MANKCLLLAAARMRQIGRWFVSSTVRRATELHRHVRNLLRAQHDLLTPEAVTAVASALGELRAGWRAGLPKPALREAMRKLQDQADRHLRDPSKSELREVNEVLLVALIVVMAARTFFVQPMKIPTGSMQPTLYGVTATNLRDRPEIAIPAGSLLRLVHKLFLGKTYYHFVALTPGRLTKVQPPEPVLPFLKNLPGPMKQRFQVGDSWYTLWFPPADLPNPHGANPDHLFFLYAGLKEDHVFQPGETIIKLVVAAGDHVLVDRLTYNFRHPTRGEIIVFGTSGISALQPGTHYIKRLVALGNERVRLGNDRHLIVDGKRLDASTPHFENVYSFAGPPADSQYSGHLNDRIAVQNRQPPGSLAPLFRRQTSVFTVHPGHYLVMGDNTLNSYDGRRWGDFPRENVVGRFLLVYWPLSRRFGWGQD